VVYRVKWLKFDHRGGHVLAKRFGSLVMVAAASAVLVSCSADTVNPKDSGEILFLTSSEPATAHMQALWDGRVSADAAGCLRLDGPDRHTVVWPHGFQLREQGSTIAVTDAGGRLVGTIGGSFRFGGGEMPTLHEGIALSAVDRQAVIRRCPGRFWIVGEI
jgi:hypothetical protein